MGLQKKMAARLSTAVVVVAMAALVFAGGASAHTGEWAAFNNCPSTTIGVNKCLHASVIGGRVKLGKKNVPIVNKVTLDGGVAKPAGEEEPEEGFSKFFAAANGETLSKTPQPVPGGLAGIVNCKEISNFLVRIGCEAIFENGLTGLNATLELAKPASEMRVNETNLVFGEGVALKMPVKAHLENPLLGSNCYIGSSSSPLIWNLTTGTTKPPAGYKAIVGSPGLLTFTEEGQILHLRGTELVENNWSAPHASGCGGAFVELILDPIIDSQIGLPSPAGANEAVLDNSIDVARAVEVNKH
jgi:hypothetical protein